MLDRYISIQDHEIATAHGTSSEILYQNFIQPQKSEAGGDGQ